MSWLKAATARTRALVGRRPLEEDLHDELRAHIEMLIEEHLQRGMSLEEVRAMRPSGRSAAWSR